MAGEIWRTYDVKAIGNDGFDDADLNALLKQKTSTNDIFKIAAASGRVDASVDQRLRKLSQENQSKAGMISRDGGKTWTDITAGFNRNYGGGSGKISRSWDSEKDDKGNPHEYGNPYNIVQVDNGKRYYDTGDQSERLFWNGINADGSAVALRGTRIEPDKDGDKRYLKRRDITWRVPDDYLPPRAESRSSSGSQQQQAVETPREAPPLTERFDASRYALRTPVPSSTDTTEEARRQTRFGYTGMGGGLELGGYERFIKNLPSGLI